MAGAEPSDWIRLRATPRSIFSWSLDLHEARSDAVWARIESRWLGERASVGLAGRVFELRRSGVFRRDHEILEGGRRIASASPRSAFSRDLVVTADGRTLVLDAQPFRRGFDLLRGTELVGTIRPVSPFRRAMQVEISGAIEPSLAVFAVWLVWMSWKRARASAGGGA